MVKHQNRESGFTLVELSIVLVIIGLIVSGVFVGQDLIESARARSAITQIEQTDTSVNIFIDKYGQLPGDLANAASLVPGCANCFSGNEDGRIYGNGSIWADDDEIGSEWAMLTGAGLTDGSYDGNDAAASDLGGFVANTDAPGTKFNSGVMKMAFSTDNTGSANYILYGIDSVADVEALTPDQAFNLDNKMDDGAPNLGRVRAFGITGADQIDLGLDPSGTAGAGKCLDADNTDAAVYQQAVQAGVCNIAYRLSLG